MRSTLDDVAYVPEYINNHFSLGSAAHRGFPCYVTSRGVKVEDVVLFKRRSNNNRLASAFVFQYPLPKSFPGKATVSPGHTPENVIGINHFHEVYGPLNKTLLFNTALQVGVKTTVELQTCTRCSRGKDLRKPIPSSTSPRPTRKLASLHRPKWKKTRHVDRGRLPHHDCMLEGRCEL